MQQAYDYTWDKEATGLLDETAIDYTASPFKIKPTYKTHCVVFECHQTKEIIAFHDGPKYTFDGSEIRETVDGEEYVLEAGYKPVEYTQRPLSELADFIKNEPMNKVIAHNQISYDLLSVKLTLGIDYSIGYEVRDGGLTTFTSDRWGDKKVKFEDTLVISKCLNPDRYGGHSLEKLASGSHTEKFKFRPHLHNEAKFKHFAGDMLYYCIFDVKANTNVYKRLMDGSLDRSPTPPNLNDPKEFERWQSALVLEHNIAELITRQEHRGFWFDRDKAHAALDELDKLMDAAKVEVEAFGIPDRPATQVFMKDFTPPAKQFKQDLSLSAHMEKFIAKHGGVMVSERKVAMLGEVYDLPLPAGVPLKSTMTATINDTTHIKHWMVGLGWNPTEYKEKDITVDTKKVKLTQDKLEAAIDRYLDQTFDQLPNFKDDRIEFLIDAHVKGVSHRASKTEVRRAMLDHAEKRGLKVMTNPTFTVGMDKEMCPDLLRLAEKFTFTKALVGYLTYKHRRNSILGGGIDWDDPDEEPEKGYISYIREDGRVPTPADTCGAATSRFKHRKVANVPRVTSLYGKELRALFGVSEGYCQIGYDFDSLEARMESAYCWQYDEDDHAYCNSLMKEKPFDVHTMMAKAISEIIGRPFGRSPAKNVKYGCTYGAQAKKVAKTIGDVLAVGQQVFDAFWLAAFPLAELKKALTNQWTENGKRYIYGVDGRRVPTRSAHAILNSLFQSAGVICAKRAMVIHDIKLKEAGLSVDFFKDDWKTKEFCQQMIAYHDEAQLEATRTLFKFKMFTHEDLGYVEYETKDEKAAEVKRCTDFINAWKAEQFETTGLIWSDISKIEKGKKGWYVAYCKAGQLAVESVSEAGKFYCTEAKPYEMNIRHDTIDLTAGYIVSNSWAGCH